MRIGGAAKNIVECLAPLSSENQRVRCVDTERGNVCYHQGLRDISTDERNGACIQKDIHKDRITVDIFSDP